MDQFVRIVRADGTLVVAVDHQRADECSEHFSLSSQNRQRVSLGSFVVFEGEWALTLG